MRSSNKSRSRNKNNNNNRRSVGNVVNRVFDSSGPEGKVRGTPQQIVDKYNTLARDAQLSGDRVAAENFQQHAEHYLRMLGEALREQAEKREAQEAQQRRSEQSDRQRDNRDGNDQGDTASEPTGEPTAQMMPAMPEQSDQAAADNGLVETPEDAPQTPRRGRGRYPRRVKSEGGDDQPTQAPDAAE